jgi:hypothetical protein
MVMLRSLNEIINYRLQGIDDEIGWCKDFLFDDRFWVVRYMVADTNKWLPGGRKVVISPISLGEPDWQHQSFPIMLSRENIKNSPLLEEHKPLSMQYETELFNYYGYGHYWMGSGLWGAYTNPAPLITAKTLREERSGGSDQDDSAEERHLRSTEEVKGYDINAIDGAIGHVEDFILNDDDWSVAYIVVDTHNWLPIGRKVLIAPDWLHSVNWVDRALSVNLTEQKIKDSPEYNPEEFINPDYENTLHKFFGAPKDR